MTYEKFKAELFTKRGAMNGMDEYIHDLFLRGTDNMKKHVVSSKRLGIKKLSDIAMMYSHKDQDKLVEWLESHPQAKKKDIEVYLLGL